MDRAQIHLVHQKKQLSHCLTIGGEVCLHLEAKIVEPFKKEKLAWPLMAKFDRSSMIYKAIQVI